MGKRQAACYCRFSSSKQREESIQKQLEKIKEYCIQNRIDLVKEYIDEAQSGTNDKRTSFQEMMDDAEYAGWNYVIVYKIDRLSRNVEDAMHYKKHLQQFGIQLVSVIESFDNATPEGGFFNLITMGMAEFYSKNLARESFAGVLQSARQCKVMGGIPPLGYVAGKDKKYIIDEKQAEAVRIIFQQALEEKSYREIAKYLNENGYRNQMDRPFRALFTDILLNRKYIGEYEFNKRRKKGIDGNHSSRTFKPEKEIVRIPGGIPQIIDNETFEKVQEILRQRKQRKSRDYRRSNYLLSGFVECQKCGYSMSGNIGYSGRDHRAFFSYRCQRKKLINCDTKEINLIYLDTYIETLLKNVFLNSKHADFFFNLINSKIKEFQYHIGSEIVEEKEKILRLTDDIKRIADSIANTRGQSQQFVVEEMNETVAQRDKIDIAVHNKERFLEQPIEISRKEIQTQMHKYLAILSKEDVLSKKTAINHFIRRICVSNEKVVTEINLLAYSEKMHREEIILKVIESRDNISLQPNQHLIKLTLSKLEME